MAPFGRPPPLQLGLFEVEEPVQAPAQPAGATAKPEPPKRPMVPQPAPVPQPPAAPTGPAKVTPGDLYHHPQATHRTELDGRTLAYLLRRSARRSIGFAISPQGLTVTAPRWATLGVVESALQSKAGWVTRKFQQFQSHQVVQPPAVVWTDGVRLPWLGRELTVRVGPVEVSGTPPDEPKPGSRRGERAVLDPLDRLWVDLPAHAAPSRLRDAVQAWMQQQAWQHFQNRLTHFAPVLGVRWTALKLSSAHTRWGSAKADGSIRLHWRLMQFAPEVLDYVVVHELAHLRHMNHSPRFWQTVGQVVPDYAALRARLRGERLPPW